MSSLDETLRALHRDRSNSKWSASTASGAPHKPLVLLALCDMAELGELTAPFVPFDGSAFETLARSFQSYWRALFPDTAGALFMPLWHLRSEGFWTPQPRGAHDVRNPPKSMASLREHHSGARLDDELFARLLAPLEREALRATLLGRYFDALTRAQLEARIRLNLDAAAYATRLRKLAHQRPLLDRAHVEALTVAEPEPVRRQGFRIAVVSAYEHHCAACGLRLQTPDGLTAVQAAHIQPWSVFHDDRITNGLALCPTCHWSFDNFLWTTNAPTRITVARIARWDRNLPAYFETLDGRDLLAPSDALLHPDPAALDWHRQHAVA